MKPWGCGPIGRKISPVSTSVSTQATSCQAPMSVSRSESTGLPWSMTVLLLVELMMMHSWLGVRENRLPRDGLEVWQEAVRAGSAPLGHPCERGEPKRVAAMHAALVGLAEGRGAGTEPCLVHDGPAAVVVGLQQPAMVEGRRLARCAAEPAEPAAGHELVNAALDRETEGRPAPADIGTERLGIAQERHVLRVGIPGRPRM